MFRIALLLVFYACVVNSDDGYGYSRSYARVKRGKYPGTPLRFYNRPPLSFPINGPFSYTPPPFMEEAPYPGSRPYKVSRRPTNDGLGDDDINNLVQHLTKQDLDKILEFAYDKDKYNEKSKYVEYKYSQSQKKESIVKPAYTNDHYRGNPEPSNNFHYQNENPYEKEMREMIKYVNYVTQATPVRDELQDDRPAPYDFKVSQNTYPGPSNPQIPETNEEDNLPPPVNMRPADYVASYTNNVPTVVQAESSSYKLENFGDLPLMDYNSKLHSVSSYHVPHYTVTQPKPAQRPQPDSYSQSFSSSTQLKPSPAAASVKAPPYEPAPPPSVAKDQSDAHLKAIKIWSHRSKGAAYTLHDDGSLTPERPWRHG
ncbi:uncharacterized protein LOC113500260 [Trichoplusia ni]|uniref:Uncharacterized protein LOC113500260 n=1 Tax=Trichoplusia ni TaxID=7111 RepID=A0A7E5W8G4_TRINI|nr:uncharacterized protein LOC113500260 [Trichoplusia ni]